MTKFQLFKSVLFACILTSFSSILSAQNGNSCVNDTIKPTFANCPRNIVLMTLDTCVIAEWTAPTASDNCSRPTVTSNYRSLNCFSLGTTNVVYTATDAKGNKGTCAFTVTANNPCTNDTTKPKFFFCPSNVSVNTSDSTAKATWNEPFATDNCGTPTIVGSHVSGSRFKVGQTTVNFTATDAKGNATVCSFKITVNNPCFSDTIKPVFTKCPDNIVLNGSDSCKEARWNAPSATDNCGTATVTASHRSGDCFKTGVTNVVYTAKDAKNNTATCSFKVTYINICANDTTKPRFANCPENIVLNTSDSCSKARWNAPTATDNCSTATVTASHTDKTCFKVGVTTVTYTAKDAMGNTSLCSFKVTVNNPCFNDTIKPKFENCPRNIVMNSADSCVRVQWFAPYATDNCGTPSVSSSHKSGDCFKSGVTTVIYTAKDAKNNTSTCSFTVTVVNPCANDTTKPKFSFCPENIVSNSTDSCVKVRWTVPMAYDNCGIPSVIGSHKPDTCFKAGVTTVIYTAKDAKGNTSTCSFTVTVKNACANDTIKPIFYNCPATITKITPDTFAKVTWREPSAIDNCGNAVVFASHESGASFKLDTTTVTYVATDSKGNIGTCSFKVIVKRIMTACSNDTIAPVFTNCPANVSVTTSASSAIAQWTMPTATDSCSTPSVSSTFRSGSSFPIGTTVVTYTATDVSRNVGFCQFNVVVTKTALVLDSTKCYILVARSSKKALTIANASTASAANAVQWTYLNASNQKWKITAADSNAFNLTNRNSNLNLDTRWGSTANGARITQWGKSNAETQKWQLVLMTNGYYKVVNKASGRVLSVAAGATATNDGSLLAQFDYAGQTSQQWSIEEVSCTNTNSNANFASNDVLEAEAKPEFNRARIEWANNTGYKNDYYEVEKLNAQSGKFEQLTVVNNTSTSNDMTYQTVYDNAPTEGDNVYRVKVVYLDSTAAVSALKTVVFKGLQTIKAFPNPANDFVDIDLTMFNNESVDVYLYNAFGQKVAHESVEKGRNGFVHFDVANQQAGSYLIRVTAQGKRDVVKQLQITK
jgi:Ricin-type beta-trefoil lectin domain-like/HYR domain/Secretion system C-terminal sorting domain